MDYEKLAKIVEKEDKIREAQQSSSSSSSSGSSVARQGKLVQPKNRGPAPVQITAEQLLRESLEFKETLIEPPQQTIINAAELAEYQLRKRKEFEDSIRRQRHNISTWIRYATWEATQQEWTRVRSIYERAIDIDYRNIQIWLKYITFEIQHRFIAHARNLFDRVITLHPRVDTFWYKYVHMEELLGDVIACRNIFKRWITFHPDQRVWFSYIKFELRYKAYDEIRKIYQLFTIQHHTATTYIRYAKFEERYGTIPASRAIYDLAIIELASDADQLEKIYVAYAEFETRQREYERVRAIYHYALDHISKKNLMTMFNAYASFEKQYGDMNSIDTVICKKQRILYEEELTKTPYNYDLYFDYLHLEQNMPTPDLTAIRALFQRGLAMIPLQAEKRHWKRYIYLWIYFMVYEEFLGEYERVTEIYEKCLALLNTVPFTFSKIWIMYAEYCIRRHDIDSARKVYGTAIGVCHQKCPTKNIAKIYQNYIEMELLLGEIDRVRTIYERWLLDHSDDATIWISYAEMEERLQEYPRARKICELGIGQTVLSSPELLWKGYIDLEIRAMKQEQMEKEDKSQREGEKVRRLYERLLDKTQHVKVWISYAQFECGIKQWDRCREIFKRADTYFKEKMKKIDQKQGRKAEDEEELGDDSSQVNLLERRKEREQLCEERVLLLTSWYEYESLYGTIAQQTAVKQMMPTQIKRKREKRDSMTGSVITGVWEEYIDYIFPEDVRANPQGTGAQGALKIMEAAKKWKLEQEKKKREQLERAEKDMDDIDSNTESSKTQVPVKG